MGGDPVLTRDPRVDQHLYTGARFAETALYGTKTGPTKLRVRQSTNINLLYKNINFL
jgi:hypothetical protein